MRKFTVILTLLAMVITALLALFSGTGSLLAPPQGHIYSLQLGSTAYGIQQAIKEAPGTVRLIHEQSGLIALGWSVKDAFAFACMNSRGVSCAGDLARVLQKGNVLNPNDVQGMIAYLQQNGWKAVTAAELPNAFRIAVSGMSYAMVLAQSEVVLILAFPLPAFDSDYLRQEYGMGDL